MPGVTKESARASLHGESSSGKRRVTVAVIGSGLAGLTAAYLASVIDFGDTLAPEVHLFEKSSSLGMDASSVTIELSEGSFRIDTPMRAVNKGSHSHVWKLYKELGIGLKEAKFSYSFSKINNSPKKTKRSKASKHEKECTCTQVPSAATFNEKHEAGSAESSRTQLGDSPGPISKEDTVEPLFLYEGSSGLVWPPLRFPSTVSGPWARLKYLKSLGRLSVAYVHLIALASFYHSTGLSNGRRRKRFGFKSVRDEPFEKWCLRHRICKSLQKEVVEPLMAGVSTVTDEDARSMPAGDIIEYLFGTFGSDHYVASQGVQHVAAALARPLPPSNLHLSTTITNITPGKAGPGVRLHYEIDGDAAEQVLEADYVIFATQANQAERLLQLYEAALVDDSAKALQKERRAALGEFEYVQNLVVNHTDVSILPGSVKDQRDLNFLQSGKTLPADEKGRVLPSGIIQATHVVSRTHAHVAEKMPASSMLLQTTNPCAPIDPALVLSEAWFERCKVTARSKAVLSRFILPDATPASGHIKHRSEDGPAKAKGDLQGGDSMYFAGSWAAEGIPLLEGCVLSAERAITAIAKREGCEIVMPF